MAPRAYRLDKVRVLSVSYTHLDVYKRQVDRYRSASRAAHTDGVGQKTEKISRNREILNRAQEVASRRSDTLLSLIHIWEEYFGNIYAKAEDNAGNVSDAIFAGFMFEQTAPVAEKNLCLLYTSRCV